MKNIRGLVVQTKPGAVPQFKRYLDEQRGVPIGDVWTDIPPINSQAKERLDYPTQKPVALLERIVRLASNRGDVVLDPFCGCGTTIHAAQKIGRQWISVEAALPCPAAAVSRRRLERVKRNFAAKRVPKGGIESKAKTSLVIVLTA
jgi:DNA modification methylase